MKRTFIKKIAVFLTVFIFIFSAVGCSNTDKGGKGNTANKDALNTEIALAITEQGDYTLDSYNEYLAILEEAKSLSNKATATQEEVDRALTALTEARKTLTLRKVEAVDGSLTAFNLLCGESKVIKLSDYVETNNLTKISYKLEANGEAVALSTVEDGEFSVTAGEVNEPSDVKVTITVFYGDAEKLKVELSVRVTKNNTDSYPGYYPDDNEDNNW